MEFRNFIEEFRKRIGGAWSFKIEEVSRHEVVMLDMQVLKGAWPDEEGKVAIITKPHFKPTARSIPLHPTSAHPPGVKAWPIAEIKRIAELSTRKQDFVKAKFNMLLRFIRGDLDPRTVLDATHVQGRHVTFFSMLQRTKTRQRRERGTHVQSHNHHRATISPERASRDVPCAACGLARMGPSVKARIVGSHILGE